ncbi:MAG: Na+/H+ antiporter NhaA [Pseudomonadota bacterium]|nr:Na+/H+ antiporter NhaA [Pseudomonadota bacterium]
MPDNNQTLPKPLRTIFAPVRALFVSDASAGVLLILVAAAAMLAANSPFSAEYKQLFYGELPFTPIPKLHDLHLWINDGLMAIFFFVVGLEVKREIVCGSLADPAARRLPMVAALAGMLVPAGVYLLVTGGGEYFNGWAIPAATDIAFAMGVLGLLGNRVPASLRLFLLTVAIVDDIGAVLVIAVFYTKGLYTEWLFASIIVFGLMIALNRFKVSAFIPYILLSLVLWYCVLNSGVHATIAGVLAALTIPLKSADGKPMLDKMEHGLAPWSSYLIVPIFGFANAGVAMKGMGAEALLDPLPLAVAAGLVMGKQIGIFSTVWLADKIGFAPRPQKASWAEIWGVSVLCGIGFTMSIFIGGLAFPDQALYVEEAKIGILLGSAISAVLGYIILLMTTEHSPEDCDDQGVIPED